MWPSFCHEGNPLDCKHLVRIEQTRDAPIAELWVGGRDEPLTMNERAQLKAARDSRRHSRSRGIVHKEVSPECDYFVTDRQEAGEAALRAGAKQVVNTLTLSVMVGSKD